ncbi:UDP-GalNAc:beta-1,3-N-acetylgalactosaminyltransferase 1 isoform X2 [Pogoniulus pusillus]|uniref:UDP-GalNAc:beta-1, 3-N-acetylgalactosaminyltransferase 1 isoform X2 n=1 Tax=Pogoniulus pusillus TaxID=488313 RepID=UPI0030B93DE0
MLLNVMHMRRLQWGFLFLLTFSVLTLWYVMFPSDAGPEQTNLMYFYDYEPLHKQRYLFTLRERPRCKDTDPFLVILVSSSPWDVKSRQAIRITWGSQGFWWGQRILTLFLLGEDTERVGSTAALSVEDESILYGDIIRQDFLDTYDNLTLKTIMAFQWVSQFCSNARFLMKTDDDVFINTPNLVKFLLRLNSSENVFSGYPLINNFAYRGFYRRRYISYQSWEDTVLASLTLVHVDCWSHGISTWIFCVSVRNYVDTKKDASHIPTWICFFVISWGFS